MKQLQSGASLIEAMIAILIIGFGLLGMAGLQAESIAFNQSAYYRSIAADLGTDLAERIRAVRTPFMASVDANPRPGKPPDFSKCVQNGAGVPVCANQDVDRNTYEVLANAEMTAWDALRVSQLPSGSSYTLVAVASGSSDYLRYTLTLTWPDSRKDNSNTSYSVVIE